MRVKCSDWLCTNLDRNRGRPQKAIYYSSLNRRERGRANQERHDLTVRPKSATMFQRIISQREQYGAWLRWILGWVTLPISPRLPA
jgi:hypothetical protein